MVQFKVSFGNGIEISVSLTEGEVLGQMIRQRGVAQTLQDFRNAVEARSEPPLEDGQEGTDGAMAYFLVNDLDDVITSIDRYKERHPR